MYTNIQKDHVFLIIMVLPKVSISNLMGHVKGSLIIRVLKNDPKLRKNCSWGTILGGFIVLHFRSVC
ncbi:MAG: hypothetical protein DRH07_11240 [Deltaproteobacteria bacterium]|nr:MAG: hypothetical protein DRH07_11240 [Deltaproteobacteria bacterium]